MKLRARDCRRMLPRLPRLSLSTNGQRRSFSLSGLYVFVVVRVVYTSLNLSDRWLYVANCVSDDCQRRFFTDCQTFIGEFDDLGCWTG